MWRMIYKGEDRMLGDAIAYLFHGASYMCDVKYAKTGRVTVTVQDGFCKASLRYDNKTEFQKDWL